MIIVEIILRFMNPFDILLCLASIAKAIGSPNSFIPLNRFSDLRLNGFQILSSQIGNNIPEMYIFSRRWLSADSSDMYYWYLTSVQISISLMLSVGQEIRTG